MTGPNLASMPGEGFQHAGEKPPLRARDEVGTSAQAERVARVWTPERVPLTLPLAGLGERALAYVVDLGVLVLVLVATTFIYNTWGDFQQDVADLSMGGGLLLGLTVFAVAVSYDTLFELLSDGRTPGKRALGLRVVTEQGKAPDVATALLRNVLRLIDFFPIFYATGTVVVFATGTRRIGDLVAGTFVVTERSRSVDPLRACEDAAGAADLGPAPAWREEDAVRALQMVERTRRYTPAAAAPLCARLLARVDPSLARATTAADARVVLARGCLALSRAPSGTMNDVRRLVEVERALTRALARPLRTLDDVFELDGAIRRAASELMRATRRDAPARVLESASLALLDAERRRAPKAAPGRSLRRFLFVLAPRTAWLERRIIGRAAVVLCSSLLLGYALGYGDAAVGRGLVGDDVAARIEAGADWTNEIDRQGAYLAVALQVIFNNVLVGLRVFLFGLLGGVGSVLGLVANGVQLGAVLGYAAQCGTASTLSRFVLAHGPTELFAICVAGAAGLCLGRAVVAPGARTRLVALREEGRTGGRLAAFSVMCFVATGVVEGFVSPGQVFPPVVNAVIGVVVLAVFLAWARNAGRSSAT